MLVPEPPSGEGWIHEIKHDGYRTLIVIEERQFPGLLPSWPGLDRTLSAGGRGGHQAPLPSGHH